MSIRGMPGALPGAVDTTVTMGRDSRTGVDTTPAAVRAALEPWGTVRACAASIEAVLYDAGEGNAAILALSRRDGFFLPVAVLNPRDPDVCAQARPAKAQGFAFARLFPEEHGYTVDGPVCLELLDACDAAGLPVMIPLSAAGPAPVARALAGRRGRYILAGVRYAVQSDCLALARKNPAVLVETSMINTPDGIAVFADALGAGRLLFGGGFPALAAGCAHGVLAGSGLPPADVGRIAACEGLFGTGGRP